MRETQFFAQALFSTQRTVIRCCLLFENRALAHLMYSYLLSTSLVEAEPQVLDLALFQMHLDRIVAVIIKIRHERLHTHSNHLDRH